MPGVRTYGEGCAAAHALDLVGERWALLVVRELLLGPKRFTDLRAGIRHASPNVLSQRLRDLEEIGVVMRRKLPPPAASRVYELTEWGMELEPVIQALGRFGARSPQMPRGAGMSADAAIIALRTMFDPDTVRDFRARLELRLGDDGFRAEVGESRLELARGDFEEPDAIVEADPSTLMAVAFGRRALADATRAGDMRIDGDRAAVKRFFGAFASPAPARVAAA
jgi:DNA-binding HxlR family transcriptional regulator/putative sterol carrier protein